MDAPVQQRTVTLDIGIFAHNEATLIGQMISDLLQQDIFCNPNVLTRVHVLANGCQDATAEVARRVLATQPDVPAEIVELAKGGKSRTWNYFVHELSRTDADFLCFLDADIILPDAGTLSYVLGMLLTRPELVASSSQPIKDIAYGTDRLTLIQKVMVAASGGLNDWKKAIIGSLYIARSKAIRAFHLPVGLPVEDGFVRAMLLTEGFSKPEDDSCLDGDDRAFHIYKAEDTVLGLLTHQTRIVIGSAINTQLFGLLSQTPLAEHKFILQDASMDETWLPRVLRARLPSARFGWIPVHFLTKRVERFFRRAPRPSFHDVVILILGFGFDFVVYFWAQFRMSRGIGAGHW